MRSNWAVDRAVDRAVSRAASTDADVKWVVRDDPPHPALADFLVSEGAETP